MRKSMLRTIDAVRPFVPVAQLKTMISCLRGEERAFFREKLREVEATVQAMPVTYQQSELGEEAVVHLHYFLGGGDWWVTEKDVEGGTPQAFGLVDMGHGPELGYISIDELVKVRGMQLDLHWQPVTLAQLRAKRYSPKPAVKPPTPRYSLEMVHEAASMAETAPPNGVYH